MQSIPFSEFQKQRKSQQSSLYTNSNSQSSNSSFPEHNDLEEEDDMTEQELGQNIEQFEKELIEEEDEDIYSMDNNATTSYHISSNPHFPLPNQQMEFLINNNHQTNSPSKKLKENTVSAATSKLIISSNNLDSLIEEIPSDIQAKLTSKVREDLTQIVQHELLKVKTESEKELLKIRQEVTSHSSSEVDKKVRQAVDVEKQRMESEFSRKQQQIYTQAVKDTEKRLQQEYENKLRQALQIHEEQVKSRLQKDIESELLNKFEKEFEKEIQKMQQDNSNNLQLLKDQLNQQLLSQRDSIRKELLIELQEQQKKEALNRSNFVDDNDGIKSGLDNSFSIADLSDDPNREDSTLWMSNEFDAKDIATKLIQDAKIGKTLNTSSSNVQSGGPPQPISSKSNNFQAPSLPYNTGPLPSFSIPNTLQPNNYPNLSMMPISNNFTMAQNGIPMMNRPGVLFQNPFVSQTQFPSVMETNMYGTNFGAAYGINDMGPLSSPKRAESSVRSKSATRVKSEKLKQEEPKIVKSKREGAGSVYETLLMNKQLQANKPSPSNPISKSKDPKTGTSSKPFNNQALQQKEILINHWKVNESSYYQRFLEQQKNLERYLSSTNNTHIQRLNSMLQWLYNYWSQLEISFQYRCEFLENKIILVIQSNNKNAEPMFQICEQNLSLEINKLNFDSQLTSGIVTLITRRESLKVKLNELNSNKNTKNTADKITITNEIKQLAKQIRTSITQWEENYKKDLMYRGLRYLDILEYDRLVAEKQEFENDMQDIQKRVKKFAVA